MKTFYLIHGWDGSPEKPMHKWIKKTLEDKGHKVIAPKMPNAGEPEINSWVEKIKEIVDYLNEDIYFIGHSIGCQAILRYLEIVSGKSGSVFLIAPWIYLDENTMEEEPESEEIAKPWMETPINWNQVKTKSKNFVCIFSDNDPYVPLSNKELFKDKLKAKIIIENNKGHFTESDKVNKLPILIKEIEKLK